MIEIIGKIIFKQQKIIGSEEIYPLKSFTYTWKISMSSKDIWAAVSSYFSKY